MPQTLELRNGNVLVVEDAKTASLVIVARDLESRDDKIEALEEVLRSPASRRSGSQRTAAVTGASTMAHQLKGPVRALGTELPRCEVRMKCSRRKGFVRES
jgi:hypothetical protein